MHFKARVTLIVLSHHNLDSWPNSNILASTMATLSINCLAFGEGPDKISVVEIPSDKTVSFLKDLMKGKNPLFANIATTDTQLVKLV